MVLSVDTVASVLYFISMPQPRDRQIEKDVVGIVVAICGSSHKDAVSREDVCRIRTVWFESSQFPPRVHVSQP